jgi:hypothetical protein
MKWSIRNQLKVEINPLFEIIGKPSVFFVTYSCGRNEAKYRIQPRLKGNVLILESTKSRSEEIRTSVYLSEDEVVYDVGSRLTVDTGKIGVVNNDLTLVCFPSA